MHPELTTKISSVIHECWKAGESKNTGKVKISADGVFARLAGADLEGGGGGSRNMQNDVMHTVIYAAFCMLPSLDLQDSTLF